MLVPPPAGRRRRGLGRQDRVDNLGVCTPPADELELGVDGGQPPRHALPDNELVHLLPEPLSDLLARAPRVVEVLIKRRHVRRQPPLPVHHLLLRIAHIGTNPPLRLPPPCRELALPLCAAQAHGLVLLGGRGLVADRREPLDCFRFVVLIAHPQLISILELADLPRLPLPIVLLNIQKPTRLHPQILKPRDALVCLRLRVKPALVPLGHLAALLHLPLELLVRQLPVHLVEHVLRRRPRLQVGRKHIAVNVRLGLGVPRLWVSDLDGHAWLARGAERVDLVLEALGLVVHDREVRLDLPHRRHLCVVCEVELLVDNARLPQIGRDGLDGAVADGAGLCAADDAADLWLEAEL
mmetsp:Transcript_4936/g.12477  ORF Transcript_4936/g.12477 Transcript_4936/m.12477 type:complete len:353 (+) Transcript_4936:1302-2360(+)